MFAKLCVESDVFAATVISSKAASGMFVKLVQTNHTKLLIREVLKSKEVTH